MFPSFWRNGLLITAIVIALGVFVAWNTRSSGLWRPGSQQSPQTKQAREEKVNDAISGSGELPGIEYEFAPLSGARGGEGETTETQANTASKAAPDLSRAIPDGMLPSAKAEMEQIIGELQKNPYNAALWSELGLYRKEAGDYEGARQAWEFAYELQPENGGFAENLGMLYGYYLKNGLKSEEFFRAAILLEPKNIHLRLRLFELYRDVFEDKAKARAAIEAALKDNPDNEQLTALLREL